MKNKLPAYKLFLTTLLVLFLLQKGIAQQYFFKKYDVEHGLLSNEVYDIIQASDNSIWAATFKGVVQFDGQKFYHYTKEEGLNSNLPRTVFEDSKGGIWVGFWNDGLNYIANGHVQSFNDSLLETFNKVIQFYEAKDGTIYIFNTRSILSYKEGRFSLLHESSAEIGYAYPNDVVQTNDGIIWIGTLGAGLVKFTPEPFNIEILKNETHNINNISYSVYKNHKNQLLVGSYGYIYEYDGLHFKEHKLPGEHDKNRVWSITQDAQNNYWLALYGNGIMVLDEGFNVVQHIHSKNGLYDTYLYKVLIDTENNKWIASQNNGLIRYRSNAFSSFSEKDGIPSTIINDVIEVKDTAYIATDRGVFSFKDGKVMNEYLKGRYVYTLAKDTSNAVWNVNDFGYGIVNGTTFNNEEDTYYTLSIDKDQKKYLAGNYFLRTIKKENHKTVRIKNLQSRVTQLLDTSFLVGNNNGLFEIANDSLIKVPSLPEDFKTIQSSCSISPNEAFFGNNDYLIYLKKDKSGYKTKVFSKNKFIGLQGFNALKVNDDRLWIASTNALAQLDIKYLLEKDSIVMTTYTHDLGFIKAEPLDNALEVFENGDVYIGTSEGLQVFAPSKFSKNNTPPTLKINSLWLFSEPFVDSLYVHGDTYKFSYKENHITFNLSAITHTYPENVQFKYRLNGLPNAAWSKPNKESKVSFPFLPPGEYEFEFTADNGFGVWQENTEKLKFTITAPFWKSSWFWVGFILLFFIALIAFISWKASVKQKRAKKYAQSLLKAQEDERKRISKELHDGIGQDLLLIKNSLAMNATKTTSLVDKTIEDIRSLSRNLHPAELEKFGLTKALKSMVEQVAEVTDLFITEEIENIDQAVSKEKSIYIYRIVQECINNILKHAEANAARIEVFVKETIHLSIQDNGKGFDVQQRKLKSKSLGLQSLHERISFLEGTLHIESKKGKGTKISIKIPV
ncbi:MAG: triple tyrosine motif-containing protein [Flavobacteriaceae bacterium]|nr:hypothetical protein [Flavobacteriaceae bacterium]